MNNFSLKRFNIKSDYDYKYRNSDKRERENAG